MDGLRVSPWKRYGYDRLYVNASDGTKVAWFDRRTGELTVLVEVHRTAVLDVLAPYLAGPGLTRPVAAMPPGDPEEGPLDPGEDLARHRPGEALRAKVDEMTPGFWRRLLDKLLGRRSEAESWRKGLVGERRMGAELERLAGEGWRVLHSVPLPRDVDIDHLLIGPGGVFCVNTKYHRGARVWVGDEAVRIGGRSYPYVRKSRAEARRASAALTRACGFAVDVRPVLAFVDTGSLSAVPSLRDVYVIQAQEAAWFRQFAVVWTGGDVEAIYAAARRRDTWISA
ncbi:NERD nuclease [Streptosporangium nondiastaticum]|uniref:NERD nuclease n=1 Tax=Streptosporangium nondiastaticum TaxID=35764 RepID=A0A9X7PIY2_9ACTN|nr:nuclease-related domain-containing protein [Streptosporangium nondiastaticum]PSJ29650.1 NERD nuclease [Streptosporangium nondiastaticum]